MKLIFDHSIVTSGLKPINMCSSNYLHVLHINLDNLIKNKQLYDVQLYLNDEKKIVIKISVFEDVLYNMILNSSWIPCYNSLINILNMYQSEIDIDTVEQLNDCDLKSWICCLDNKIHNHNSNYSYYNNNIIELSDKLFYNKSSGRLLTTPPLKKFKSYNGGAIIDTLGIKNKKELYTIIKRPSHQTNGTILKKIYNSFKINRFITSNKTLLICPPKMQKQLKQKIKYVKSIILTNKNYNKITLNDIDNIKVIICSYNFLNSLIPSEYKTEEEINNNLYAQIYTLFNKPPKVNPFIVYWEQVIMYNYDHLFKSNDRTTNRIHILLKIIESITQWIFLNNQPNKDETEYIIKQLFRSNNIQCITNKLIKNILVKKSYNVIINKTIISKPLELTTKEQIILNSDTLSNAGGFKNELEKSYPLLFGDVVVDFKFFNNIKEIQSHIMNNMQKKVIKYEKLISKLESGEIIQFSNSTLKKKISKINSQIRYFTQLFSKKELDSCPICITDVKESSLAITKCGHIFCYYCVLQSIMLSDYNYINCPQCREKLRLEKIYAINIEKDELSQYGIKIGTLIDEISKSDHKIVVLSKWGVILKYLKELLKASNIKPNKYLLLGYQQLDKLEKRYKSCIMLDTPPNKYKRDKINYHCDSVVKYTLIGVDNNVDEL
jgi:hypothetical protein